MFYLVSNWNRGPLEETTDCFQAMACRLSKAFDRLQVKHEPLNFKEKRERSKLLYIGYFRQIVTATRRDRFLGNSMYWLQERCSGQRVHRGYFFLGSSEGNISLKVPIPLGDEYEVMPKDDVILIDHHRPKYDHTEEVMRMANEVAGKSRLLVQRSYLKQPELRRPFEELPMQPYGRWLKATNRVRAFLVTHFETFGYAVLDFLARGTPVFAYRRTLNPELRSLLDISEFRTVGELQSLLSRAVDHHRIASECRKKLATYDRVAYLIRNDMPHLGGRYDFGGVAEPQ